MNKFQEIIDSIVDKTFCDGAEVVNKDKTRYAITDAMNIGRNLGNTLFPGETGTFGQAISALNEGYAVRRKSWENDCVFLTKCRNENLSMGEMSIKMDGLSNPVKKKIVQTGYGSIRFKHRVLVVYPECSGMTASYYIPDWEEIFATDWEIVKPLNDML